MTCKKLKKYLDEHETRYITRQHSRAYTAQEIAELSHVSGNSFAKVVMLKADDKMLMAVLPASEKVDLEMLREALHARKVIFANEEEFQDHFPGCEIGAMPPFGNLYGIAVISSRTMCDLKTISFNSGVHTEVIQLDYADYIQLVEPEVLDFVQA